MGFLSWLFGDKPKASSGARADPGRYQGPNPLSTFDGWVKQIRSEMLEERTRAFLDIAFPGFTRKLGEVNPRILTPLQEFSEGRLRRYAGSTGLPPGQYFTLARQSGGDDGGTLVAELLSYWNADSRLAVWITDPSVPDHGEESSRSYVRSRFGDKPCLCISIAETMGLEQGTVLLGTEIMLVVPVLVVPVHATHVLDLRLPQAQDWFCRTFGPLECQIRDFGGWAKLKPERFRDMIPTLLHPALGGIAFHHAVGAWLSSHGVSALIYPSARRDAQVAAQGQTVVSHDGWNLVAFGGLDGALPKPVSSDQFGFLGKWLSTEDVMIDLSWEETDQGRAWRVTGVESRESQRRRSLLMDVTQQESGKGGWLRERLEQIGFVFPHESSGAPRRISATALFSDRPVGQGG
jgi:hypothetical protein